VNNPPTVMRQRHHYEQDAKGNGRHGEQIDSDDGAEMVVEKCPPALRWRLASPGISRDTVRSETSRPRCCNSPWMRGAPHSGLAWAICLINVSDLCRDPWPTDAFSPRQPSPIETENLAMPGDNSLRFDDNQSLPPTGPDF
jgi:hypothetical protein